MLARLSIFVCAVSIATVGSATGAPEPVMDQPAVIATALDNATPSGGRGGNDWPH